MNSDYYVRTYTAHYRELVERYGPAYAMEMVVGGEYDAVGASEECALLNLGLQADHNIIDVGCGTGRLSTRLAKFVTGNFVGTDLLPEVLDYARTKAARPDWTFLLAPEPPLPVAAGQADWVTFFSVFTHILDEHAYLYLEDAKRLLKPAGKVVISFLDFSVPLHWQFFEGAVRSRAADRTMVHFLNRPTIQAWADHLGFVLEAIYSGEEKWMRPLGSSPGILASGLELAAFGQSVAVLALPHGRL